MKKVKIISAKTKLNVIMNSFLSVLKPNGIKPITPTADTLTLLSLFFGSNKELAMRMIIPKNITTIPINVSWFCVIILIGFFYLNKYFSIIFINRVYVLYRTGSWSSGYRKTVNDSALTL